MRSTTISEWTLPTSRRLGLIAATIVAITIAVASTLSWDQRNAVVANAQQDLTNLGIVLAEQMTRSLQAVDLVLRDTAANMQARGLERPGQFKELLAGEAIH